MDTYGDAHSASTTPASSPAPAAGPVEDGATGPRKGLPGGPWALTVLFAATTVIFAFLWLGVKSDADDANAELAEIEAAEAAAQAERDALPNLEELADEHGLSDAVQRASDDYVSFNFRRYEPIDDLADFFDDLGFSSAIMDRIGNTRALDGTLTAEGDKATASWTYHPDAGLNLVVERDD